MACMQKICGSNSCQVCYQLSLFEGLGTTNGRLSLKDLGQSSFQVPVPNVSNSDDAQNYLRSI